MKKHVQGLSAGINQDISSNKYPNNNYYWAQNLRLTSKDGLSTGALTNVKGNIPKIALATGEEINGYCTIRDTLILFVNTQEGTKQIDTVTLSGTSGTANITVAGLEKLVTFNTDLTTTASDFVTSWEDDYLAEGVVVTSDGVDLVFTAETVGTGFNHANIANVSGDLAGSLEYTQNNSLFNKGKIYKWDYSSDDSLESPTLVYTSDKLDLSNPVKAIGRYETSTLQKVYFTDGETYFKFLNIIPQTGEEYPLNNYISADSLDIVAGVTFSNIDLELSSGGSLKAGKIQYAYQLYSSRGNESMFSPTSQLVHLTNSNELQNSSEYTGSEVGDSVNKVVNITVNDIDEVFTRLRLIALEYTVLYQQPSIRIVGEYNVENLTNITISDTGSSIGEITLEEFRFIQNDFYPKTLDVKNNYLFAANIKNNYFEITDDEFDARAFRASVVDNVYVYNGSSLVEINHTDGEFNAATLPAVTAETYAPYNDIGEDYNEGIGLGDEFFYKYKPGSTGTILGGKGLYIDYEFTTEEVVLDDSPRTNDWGQGYPRLNIGASTPFENNANPLSKVGYQRDEIYRFGIVFFDKKGRQSFVKWIGDIRFPSNRDSDDNGDYAFVYYDSVNNRTMGRILGIKFNVNLPNNIRTKVSGYQIVRAERTNSDKTIVSQGLIGNPISTDMGINADEDHMYTMATLPTVKDMHYGYTNTDRETENFGSISGVDEYETEDSRVELQEDWLEFNSPEIAINKSNLPTNNAFLDIFAFQNEIENTAIAGVRGFEDNSPGDEEERDVIVADKTRNLDYESSSSRIKCSINYSRLFTPQSVGASFSPADNNATKYTLEGGQIYNNQAYSPSGRSKIKSKWGLRGTHSILKADSPISRSVLSNWMDVAETDIRFLTANYKIDKGRSIYGGSSYESRINTKYYPTSEFQKVTSGTEEVEEIVETGSYAFGIKYAALPINACSGTVSTVYSRKSIPLVGDILYKDAGLTEPWDTSGGACILFDNHPIYGDEVVGVAIIDVEGGEYEVGEIMLRSNYFCGSTPGYGGDEDEASIEVYNGDTYISYFTYIRSIYDKERSDGYRIESYMFYPVESTINLELRLDKMQDNINWGFYRDSGVTNYKLMESISNGVLRYGTDYPSEVGNLYRYNSAYSCIDKSKEYICKPFDFISTIINDTRIVASEKKINGEYIDSWTKFKFNNYIDVDGKHYGITRLVTFKNNLFFFQPTGVGVASVNDRSLIQDNQPGQLSLGTGGILPRYDYLTDKSGTAHYEGITTSDNFIYYVDGRRKRINKIVSQGENAISVIKGIDSLMNTQNFNFIRTGFDRGYNEIVFAIDDIVIAFNELTDAFVSSYTFYPRLMFSIDKDFFSIGESDENITNPWLYSNLPEDIVGYSGENDTDPNWDYILIDSEYGASADKVYKHNTGDYGVFYNQEDDSSEPEEVNGVVVNRTDSYITLIINPAGNTVCFFDNLDLRTDSFDTDGVDDPDDIFYLLDASNNYQRLTKELGFEIQAAHQEYDSGTSTWVDVPTTYTVNKGTIKRIGRIWRTALMGRPTPGTSNPRLMDTYLKLMLRYNNNTNNFKIHDVTTYIRPSKH